MNCMVQRDSCLRMLLDATSLLAWKPIQLFFFKLLYVNYLFSQLNMNTHAFSIHYKASVRIYSSPGTVVIGNYCNTPNTLHYAYFLYVLTFYYVTLFLSSHVSRL